MFEEPEKLLQKRHAAICIISIDISNEIINEAIKNVSQTLKPQILTRQNYAKNRKRNFQIVRASTTSPSSIDYSADPSEGENKPAYYPLETEPNCYLKNFKRLVFSDVILKLNKDNRGQLAYVKIDLSGQLIGSAGLESLLSRLQNSPVEILSLAENEIDDVGMACLGKVLRLLPNLKELYLNSNKITDAGVESIFNSSNYSFSLKLINLARNSISRKSAYFIGSMFSPNFQASVMSILFSLL